MPFPYSFNTYIKAYCVFYIYCLYKIKKKPNYNCNFIFTTLKKY